MKVIVLTSVGQGWAEESYCANFRRPERPTEVKGSRGIFIG
jgi:hypothetical protein